MCSIFYYLCTYLWQLHSHSKLYILYLHNGLSCDYLLWFSLCDIGISIWGFFLLLFPCYVFFSSIQSESFSSLCFLYIQHIFHLWNIIFYPIWSSFCEYILYTLGVKNIIGFNFFIQCYGFFVLNTSFVFYFCILFMKFLTITLVQCMQCALSFL